MFTKWNGARDEGAYWFSGYMIGWRLGLQEIFRKRNGSCNMPRRTPRRSEPVVLVWFPAAKQLIGMR